MGMTCEQFWDQDCELVVPFRKAYQIRQENENRFAWLQGLYVYEAICDVSPILHAFAKSGTKAHPYPDKPYEFAPAKKKEKTETNREKMDNAVGFMGKIAAIFNRQFNEKKQSETEKPPTEPAKE